MRGDRRSWSERKLSPNPRQRSTYPHSQLQLHVQDDDEYDVVEDEDYKNGDHDDDDEPHDDHEEKDLVDFDASLRCCVNCGHVNNT